MCLCFYFFKQFVPVFNGGAEHLINKLYYCYSDIDVALPWSREERNLVISSLSWSKVAGHCMG